MMPKRGLLKTREWTQPESKEVVIMNSIDRARLVRATLVGGLAAGILDAVDAVVAFKAVLGLDPIPIYQFVASGMLGPSAFSDGAATALVGLAAHFLIAFSAAAVFVVVSARWRGLLQHYAVAGALHGIGVFVVMNYVVIPLSRIPAAPFSLPLFLNGVIGHALLVGLPIAYAAKRYLASDAMPAAVRRPLVAHS
jgi:hypothetical protein